MWGCFNRHIALPDGWNCIPPRTAYHDSLKLTPKLLSTSTYVCSTGTARSHYRVAMHDVATCVNDRFTSAPKPTPPSMDRYYGACVYFVNPNLSLAHICLSFRMIPIS
jgi:hypothetical protein